MNVTPPGLNSYWVLQMMSLNEFLSMGGYATYVWSSYGICCVVLILNIIQPLKRERKTIRELQKRLQSQKDKQQG